MDLFGLSDKLERASSAQQKRQLEWNVKAKSTITPTLSSGLLTQISATVNHGDKAAKDLST